MALQDLTPQLRTRLSRMERAAGWFVLLAALLMLAGLAYYLKVMAERKGWGLQKVRYQTSLMSAAGLKVGDPVKLFGRDVGQITGLVPNEPSDYYAITVYFRIKSPDYGYVWSDSVVKVSSDLFGNRFLEVTKGAQGVPTVFETTNKLAVGILKQNYFKQRLGELMKPRSESDPRSLEERRFEALVELNTAAIEKSSEYYDSLETDKVYWVEPAEAIAVNERLDKLVSQAEAALPNILALTNQVAMVLNDISRVSTNAAELLASLNPVAANVAVITENIRDPKGSLGEWLIPTNISLQLEGTLTGVNTNLPIIAEDIDRILENLAGVTSNLNAQVQANSNMLSGISQAVTSADELMRGLQRHWLLRSAFKKKKSNP